MLNYNVSTLIKLELIIPLFESDRHFGAVFCKQFDIQLQNENFEIRCTYEQYCRYQSCRNSCTRSTYLSNNVACHPGPGENCKTMHQPTRYARKLFALIKQRQTNVIFTFTNVIPITTSFP